MFGDINMLRKKEIKLSIRDKHQKVTTLCLNAGTKWPDRKALANGVSSSPFPKPVCPFPQAPHKTFLLGTVIFSQHNDTISLAKYQNQCSCYLSAVCAAKRQGISVDSIN